MKLLSRANHLRATLTSFIRSHPLMTLCLIGAFVSFVGISNELWTPDEPRDAAIGRAMWTSGSWVTPRLNGEPFLEKPPLYWWVQSSVFAAFGRATPTLARLPSAVFGFGALLLTYVLGRCFFSSVRCLIGGLILLSTALFSLTTHWIVVDNALLFAVTGAWTLFAYAESRDGATRQFLFLGMYVFLAIAFLTKGLVGLGIPTLGMGVYLLWTGRLRQFFGWHIGVGGGLIACAATVWLWSLWREGGRASLETFLLYNQLGRFFPDAETYQGGHVRPIWYYVINTPVDLLPWTPFVLLAALSVWRNWERLPDLHRDGLRLCIAGTLPVFLALSLAGTKRGMYLLPIFPLIALFVAFWATSAGQQQGWETKLERGWELFLIACAVLSPAAIFFTPGTWPFWLGSVVVLFLFWYVWKFPPPVDREARLLGTALLVCLSIGSLLITVRPFVDRFKSFVPFVRQLEKHVPAAAQVYAYRPDETTLGVIGFYTGRQATVVELEQLKNVARGPATIWLITRDNKKTGGYYGEIQDAGIPHRVLSEQVIGDGRVMRIIAVGENMKS
jgi:4-amino-4-deoxy-L-arabinose transferase-like glycosyltransferase